MSARPREAVPLPDNRRMTRPTAGNARMTETSTRRLRGAMSALVTPFKDGAFDEAAFRKFVNWQIAEGIHGLVPTGTTGESPTLSHAEHDRVVEICIEEAGGRVPVIAGAGSNSTAEAVERARHAEKAGADAVLVVTPYYNKPTQAGLYAHFKAVNDAIGIPIILYNIPGRSIVDMSVETMARLYELTNIAGVKDATAKLDRVSLQRQAMGEDFIQLSGEDATAHLGGVERRAATLRRAPGGDPGRRLCQGAPDPGPADAVARQHVCGTEPVAGEVRPRAARPDDRRGAAAASDRERRDESPGRRRLATRGPARRLSQTGKAVRAEPYPSARSRWRDRPDPTL
jgi:hypothetical protein